MVCRFVVIYLDDEGYEAWREEYPMSRAMERFGKIVEEMMEKGVRVKQVGDKIYELF